jgi:hypothetical protein
MTIGSCWTLVMLPRLSATKDAVNKDTSASVLDDGVPLTDLEM